MLQTSCWELGHRFSVVINMPDWQLFFFYFLFPGIVFNFSYSGECIVLSHGSVSLLKQWLAIWISASFMKCLFKSLANFSIKLIDFFSYWFVVVLIIFWQQTWLCVTNIFYSVSRPFLSLLSLFLLSLIQKLLGENVSYTFRGRHQLSWISMSPLVGFHSCHPWPILFHLYPHLLCSSPYLIILK